MLQLQKHRFYLAVSCLMLTSFLFCSCQKEETSPPPRPIVRSQRSGKDQATVKKEEPKIHINPYLTKRNELNTSIHEFAHAFFWDIPEKDVYKFANTLSKFLYTNCNWRKLEKSRNNKYKGK